MEPPEEPPKRSAIVSDRGDGMNPSMIVDKSFGENLDTRLFSLSLDFQENLAGHMFSGTRSTPYTFIGRP